MSRLRWGLGAVLGLVALVAAASALRTYVGHKLWLGGLAVVVLAAIDLVGFGSLARARRRLAIEIKALSADPPGGAMLAERTRHLQAILAASARPDLDALAEATAAAELGRAYLGKYLVAVTVLVGLVGTFAGLMETLHGVAPLLADERVTTLQALAGPLAGLDVTFGASLVGILVTLALALVQGDLALAEEEALARLEERTRHVLVPKLWPPAEAADERAARELAALRGELASFVARGAEAAGERVARVAAVEVDRMVRSVRAAVEDSVQGTATRVEAGLLGMASTVEAKLGPVLAAQEERLAALQISAERAAKNAVEAGAQAAGAIARAAEGAQSGITLSIESVGAAQAQLAEAASGVFASFSSNVRESVLRVEVALSALGERQTEVSTQLLQAHAAEAARLGAAQVEAARRTEEVLERLTVAQAARSAALEKEQAQAATRVATEIRAVLEGQAQHARELLSAQHATAARAEAALQRLAEEQGGHTERLLQAQQAATQQGEAALQKIVEEHAAAVQRLATAQGESGARSEAVVQQLIEAQAAAATRVEAALAALVQTQAIRLAATTESLCETVRTSVGGEGLRLHDAAQALGKAAADLGAAAQAVGEPIAVLTPELRSLSREVALLAARSEPEEPTAVLHELIRLGEGMEQLEALLRMAQGPAGGRERAA